MSRKSSNRRGPSEARKPDNDSPARIGAIEAEKIARAAHEAERRAIADLQPPTIRASLTEQEKQARLAALKASDT